MQVKSITPISDYELNKIREICESKQDIEEALYDAFPYAFHHMNESTIYFGSHSYDYTYEIVVK